MSPTQTARTYVPSVRGDAMLLTHGRKGTAEDLLLVSAAVVLDGALGGHIQVVGRRFLGIERRRVVAGALVDDAPLLMADLRSRVLEATPDDPWGWFDRAALFALERVSAELAGAGVTTPLRLSGARRLLRHDTLIVAESAEDAARARLLAALTGAGTSSSIALGAILLHIGLLDEIVGRRDTRRLESAVRGLPSSAQAFLAVLRDQRRREAQLAY
ncbi:GPP34 family phosphoprotein [Solirubrobacter soli]|uniref:GPP34 family phosphoprotein n=1 Tax=Solirubrobacter soli TaxID=363832 RepID=UPI000404E6B5|nr:GPP34 family phosphoprotein [Solirubrobacter soli]